MRLCGLRAEDWYVEEARTAMEQGELLYAGKYSGPDYELLLAQGCTLSIQNTMIEHAPEVREKLQDLGIAVLEDYSSYEAHPLGRCEWIKAVSYTHLTLLPGVYLRRSATGFTSTN